MITINKTISYTDTEENLTFWATKKGFGRPAMPGMPAVSTDLKTFIEDYFMNMIKRELVSPIQQEVAQRTMAQIKAETEAAKAAIRTQQESAAAQVLANLTIE